MELPQTLYDLPRTLLGFHTEVAKAGRRRRTGLSIEERVVLLEAERDIRSLIHQYAYCYDSGDVDGLMDIYSSDCRIINNRGTFVGTAEIRANYDQNISERAIAFHHVSDVQLAVNDAATEAWATGYLYNLAVRDVATGTMANCLFHVKLIDDIWQVVESRIAVSNQHKFVPREVAKAGPGWRPETGTVHDLIDDYPAA